MLETQLTKQLNMTHPIIQAGMAGGVTTPRLVAAVSNAGGLGTLGAGYLSPSQLTSAIREIKAQTSRPFAVNLLVPPNGQAVEEEISAMTAYLDEIRRELGLGPGQTPTHYAESFDAQMEAILAEGVPIFSFTFGIPERHHLDALKAQGTCLIGTATTVQEAIALEQAGVDAIVAQGSEAGGHRGTFLTHPAQAMIGTMALVPQVVDAVSIPVVASGGIMDGRGLAAALMLGAAAVQSGTVFLTCDESGANATYQQRVLDAVETDTQITDAYSGRAARGIRTAFMERMSPYQGAIPAYPIQNALTRDIRKAAAERRNADFLSLWAGQGLRMTRSGPAADVVSTMMAQAAEVLSSVHMKKGEC